MNNSMTKNKKIKHLNLKITVIFSIIVINSILLGYRIHINKIAKQQAEKKTKFEQHLLQYDNFIKEEKYEEAFNILEQAKEYGNSENLEKDFEFVKIMKNSVNCFKTAEKSMNKNEYYYAWLNYRGVDEKDIKRYPIAQEKIKQCIDLIIQRADEFYKNGKYENALRDMEMLLEKDKDNKDIIALRDMYLKTKTGDDNIKIDLAKKEQEKQEQQKKAEQRTKLKANMNQYEEGNDGIGIAVGEVKVTNSIGEYSANGNCQFVLVNIGVKNCGSKTVHTNPNYFTLTDENGHTVNYDTHTTFGTNNYYNAIDLNPNNTCSGWLVFYLPKSSQYTLNYNSFSGTVKKIVIVD